MNKNLPAVLTEMKGLMIFVWNVLTVPIWVPVLAFSMLVVLSFQDLKVRDEKVNMISDAEIEKYIKDAPHLSIHVSDHLGVWVIKRLRSAEDALKDTQTFYFKIRHGDQKHMDWLKEKTEKHFSKAYAHFKTPQSIY